LVLIHERLPGGGFASEVILYPKRLPRKRLIRAAL
jgi:hypothetical protein